MNFYQIQHIIFFFVLEEKWKRISFDLLEVDVIKSWTPDNELKEDSEFQEERRSGRAAEKGGYSVVQ